MVETKKNKPKPKEPVKESKPTTKQKPKPTPTPKPKPKPTGKPKPKPKGKPDPNGKGKQITIEYQGPAETLNENKYSEKIKSLIDKIRNQNTEVDHGIRFCWKN